ncbi:MAG: SPOR domain-containing protein [Saprospiraceae bacterium]
MSRSDYLIIAVVAICLAALVFLVYQFSQLSKEREPELPEAPLFEQGDNFSTPEMDTTLYEDYPEIPDTVQELTAPVAPPAQTPARPKPAPAPVTAPETPPSAGDYMVLAGSFRQRIYADERLRQLRKMGYPQATVSLFDKGTYAVVVVDRFTTNSEAVQLAQELRRKGVDAIVQKKR